MTPTIIALVARIRGRLPNWLTSILGVCLGLMAAFDVLTWEELTAALAGLTWAKIFNWLVGLAIAAGGIRLYNDKPTPTSEAPILLTDMIDDED